MDFEYYFNNVPGIGKTRNNLVYTSLISKDKKTFVKWFNNDTDYHRGQNEVVDLDKMEEKWERELKFLTKMANFFPNDVPKILDIDFDSKKIYLEIDGIDFWNKAKCMIENYDIVLPDWQEQMLDIINKHFEIGLHKYSMHPSSYFIVDGKLKSINYFFCYDKNEPYVCINDVSSHIHSNRQTELKKYLKILDIDWYTPQPWHVMDKLCWKSFSTNYPQNFIQRINV